MMEPEQPLQINLLGDFCLIDQGAAISGMRGRSQQLLAYLILHRQAPQPRRRVASTLWPDTLERQARTNLRKELHLLRHTYPPIEQLVSTTHQTLQWQPTVPCRVDVDIFESALAAATAVTGQAALPYLETALDAYQGDLWPDSDAEWLYPDQERLRQQHVRALAQATRLLKDTGATAKAMTLGQQWLAVAPLDEGAYQTLMVLYGEQGDRATALQLYHQCMTTLQTELGVTPSATTANLYQQLLMDAAAAEAPPAVPAIAPPHRALPVPAATPLTRPTPANTLVGRDELCLVLEQWLSFTDEPSAPLLLLTGEPGIGKTRLLEALAASATQQHYQAGWGRAFAAEQLRSYGVWIDLLRGAPFAAQVPNLTALSTDLREASAANLRDRGQLLDATVQGLGSVATSAHPLLLLFDDIHWLDEASTTLLHYVFRLLGQGALRIAGAARAQELQANPAVVNLVKSLRRANRLQEIAVPPLSAEAVSMLVQPLESDDLKHPLDPQKIYADSGGNPLFALEAARAVTQTNNTLADLIGDRLQRLGATARDLLPWAAALGRRFDPTTLALAAGYAPLQFLTAIEQLEAQQIVCPTPLSDDEGQSHYDFVHDLVRQVAYKQLSEPRRRLVHGQLAKTLNRQTVDADLASQVAYHAARAGDHALAARAYAAAADRSLRLFAYQDVMQLVSQGLHHSEYLPSRDRLGQAAHLLRTRVLAGVATAEVAGVESQLQQLAADLEGLSIPAAEITVQEALNILNYGQGKLVAVHQQTLKALDALPPSPQLQAQSLAANGCCLAEIERDIDRAEAVLLEAQTLADRLGLSLLDVATGLGCVERYRGHYDQARTYLEQAHRLAQNQQSFVFQGHALSHLAMTGWDGHHPKVADAQALWALSAQLPEGSEGDFAQALIALSTYAKDPGATEALTQSLHQLQQLDAQRKRVFVASHASEIALAHNHRDAAQHYATIAHQAAQVVGHPNDLVIAAALQVLSATSEDDQAADRQRLQTLLMDDLRLSARAQSLCDQAQR
ncbi:MAG: BTAD domain-containing putative transcriptional regulator [Leptolyngbyaceae cyanobacterium]